MFSRKTVLQLALGLGMSFGLYGCATYITETKAPERKLASFHTVSIEVHGANADTEKYAHDFNLLLTKRLKKEKLFTVTDSSGGDLTLKINIASVSEGDKAKRAMNLGGEAEVVANGELVASADNHVIGSFTAKGDSRRGTSMSVGGVNVTKISSLGDNLVERASDSTSEHIAKYLKSKM